MNSELIKKLRDLLEKKENEITEVKEEYERLTKIDYEPTREDKARIKEIRKEISPIASDIKEISEDIEYLEELNQDIEELEMAKETITSEKAKEVIESELESKKETRDSFVENLEEKYEDELKEEQEENTDALLEEDEEELEEKKPVNKKKVAVSVVAILLALGIGVGLGRCSKKPNEKQNPDPTPSTGVTDTLEPAKPAPTPSAVIDDLKFTDINDKEQVAERAAEILTDFNDLAPELGINEDDIIDILNYINGGVVNETSREATLFVITEIEELMNNEMNYTVDYLNKGESGHVKPSHTVDYSKFYLDGSQGQKLAKEVSDLRSKMINNPEQIQETSTEFTKLLMNSWYLNGNGVISAYALETSGMEALTDKLFLSTAMIAGTQDVVVINPLTGDEETLVHIIDEINKADCPQEMKADNGEVFTKYVNKFSYDLEGMLKEAVYNKQAYEENFGRTLSNN